MHDLNPVPPPFMSVAVGFALLVVAAWSSLFATTVAWVRNPNAVGAVITGLFLLALGLLVIPCLPFLRKPKPTQTQTRSATEGDTEGSTS
ncbi:hypothetical protein LGM54_30585 [Burkholderia cenocepacia]|uniref:hypothetical protein n=1 Tax=Burkholderia cenocepacia TaxID=95486 RepID=UPI001CF2F70D|nr:hypothetical protein [Burkholderia cenocepacia]MCA7967333.1 hypothetical protein [Burkholderia cenocepacia]